MAATARAALLFAALTIVMAAPWSLHPATRVVTDDPDMELYVWNIGWVVHALTTDPLRIFDANIFHPMANTLAYSENVIGSGLLAAPVVWLTGNLVLGLNVVLLLACALSGVGTFVLGRRLGLGVPASVVAGLVFAFAPTRFYRMGQLHLNTLQWIPFTLAFAHTYLETGRSATLRVAAALFTAQALTSGHGALMLAVALCALGIYAVARGAPLEPRRRLRDLGVPGLLLLLPSALLVLPYRRVQAELGLDRSIGTTALSPESFLASPTNVHRWILEHVTSHDVNAAATTFLFPGYLALMLAIVALWPRATGPGRSDAAAALDRHVVFYALLAVLSVGFFASGPLNLWPWVSGWPGFDFIRAPTRFAILMTLTLAVLAGAGVERLTARRSPRAAALAATLAGALVLGEYSTHPFSGVTFAPPAPAIVRYVATLPRPFVIAEVPVPRITREGAFERFQTAAMLHTVSHWQPTIHGYSGLRPPRHEQVFQEMNTFPGPASLAAMRSLGVTHVVVHRPEYPPEVWPDLDRQLRGLPGVRVLHEEADGLLLGLDAVP